MRDCTEPAGEGLLATGSVGGHKRRTQLCGKSSGAAGLLQNVTIEDIKKRRPEIDHPSLGDLSFLSYRDVLVSSSECASAGQSSGLVAKSERCGRGKGVRIEKRRGERIQIPAIGLLESGNDIHARTASEVTSGEKNITRCTAAGRVNCRRQSGLVRQH